MGMNLRRSIKSLLQLASANVAVKFIGIFILAFFTRYLTKEQLAVLPVYEMLAALAPVVFGFGILPTLLRSLPAMLEREPAQARGLVFTAWAISAPGSALFSGGVAVFAERLSLLLFESPDFAGLLRILSLGFFFASMRNFTHYLLWSSSRFDRISVVRMTGAVGRAVFAAGLLFLFGMKGLAWGLVLNEFTCLTLSIVFMREFLFSTEVEMYPPLQLLKKSFLFYCESFLIYFRTQGDNWIVAAMLGPQAIAVYFVAKRFPQMLLMVVESVDKIATTEIAKRKEKPEEIRKYIRDLMEIFAHLVLPFFFVAAGVLPAFIFIVAGQAYTAAIIPGILLCMMQMTTFLSIPLSRGIFVTRPPQIRVVMTTVESVSLIGLLLVLSPLMAATGVALSRWLAAGAGLATSYLLLRRRIHVGLPWRQFLYSTIASLLLGGSLLFLILWRYSLFELPIYGIIALTLFLVFVSAVYSEAFYRSLNRISPFRVVDPVRWLIGRMQSRPAT